MTNISGPLRKEGGLRSKCDHRTLTEPGRPLVSVITVVRNGAGTLEKTILSVLEQSYKNVEYIVVDGGSTDGTLDVIRKYEDRIAYWISEPDKGIYDAMNKGARLATGEWINFMNAGDTYYQNDVVQTIVSDVIDSTDLLYGHCQLIFGTEQTEIWRTSRVTDLWKGMVFRHQSLFARSPIVKSLPFRLDVKIGADYDFVYECFMRGYHFQPLDRIISSVSAGGISDVHVLQALRDNYRSVTRHHWSPRIWLYFLYKFIYTSLKFIGKKMLSERILGKARSFKYRH